MDGSLTFASPSNYQVHTHARARTHTPTHAHTRTHTHTHACTHTCTHKAKKPLVRWSHQPRVLVWAPKVPPGPHPSVRHKQQFDICFPSFHQLIRSPLKQLGRLGKVSCSTATLKWPHQESNLEPFYNQTGA